MTNPDSPTPITDTKFFKLAEELERINVPAILAELTRIAVQAKKFSREQERQLHLAREALKPLAGITISPGIADENIVDAAITVADIKRAREASK